MINFEIIKLQNKRAWLFSKSNRKYTEAAAHYKEAVAAMLEEEKRIASLTEGPFAKDIEIYWKHFGSLVGVGKFDAMDPRQQTEYCAQELKEIAYGERRGSHIRCLEFNDKQVDLILDV